MAHVAHDYHLCSRTLSRYPTGKPVEPCPSGYWNMVKETLRDIHPWATPSEGGVKTTPCQERLKSSRRVLCTVPPGPFPSSNRQSTLGNGSFWGLTHGSSMTGNPPHIRGAIVRGSCVCCAFALPRTSRPLRDRHAGERLILVSLPPHLHLLLATTQQSAYVQQYHQFLAQVRYSQYVVCPLRHCYSRRRLYH